MSASSPRFDILGIGNAIVDVVAPVEEHFISHHGLHKGAMSLIDADDADKLYAAMPAGIESSGGSLANSCAVAAQLGAKVAYIGKVADDQLGRVFRHDIQAVGVHFPTRPLIGGAPTARCLIAVTPDGQRSMNTYLGACRELAPDDVNEEDVAQARILYIEGYLWDEEAAKDASRKAIAAMKGAGGRVALTLSDSFCVGRFRDEFLHLLDKDVNILFANEDEATALFQAENFDGVVEGARKWGGIAALTRSAKGCVIVEDGMVHEIPAAPVSRVLDTTGAGDQFAAGFLYGLTHGKGLPDCGRLGALAAAEVISHYGARPEVSLKDLATKAGLI